jgi:hypothetical protein
MAVIHRKKGLQAKKMTPYPQNAELLLYVWILVHSEGDI